MDLFRVGFWMILSYRYRSGLSGEWEDVEEPVPLQ